MNPQTEEVLAQFFDKDALIEPARRIYRVSRYGERMYFVTDPAIAIRPGVTTVIKSEGPMSPWLMKWIAEHGIKQAEYRRDSRAAYGTLMHMLFAKLLIARELDLAGLEGFIAEYVQKNSLPFDTGTWAEELAEDLVGFACWVREYEVKPIGIEVPIFSEELGYAGTLDLPCEFNVYKGSKVIGRTTGYVDYKSNRESFYDENVIQSHAYVKLWNAAFPHKPLERVCLYGPKNWNERSRGKYRFEDVTDHPKKDRFERYLLSYNEDHEQPTRARILGTLSLDTDPNQNVTFLSLADYLKEVA